MKSCILSIVKVDLPISIDLGPESLDALMQVLLRIRLDSPSDPNFRANSPTQRHSSFCSLWDERDAAQSQQDKSWRLLA